MNDDPRPVEATASRARRGMWALLADPVFGWFIAGKTLATLGMWMHNIVAAIVAYEVSGSTFVVGLVSVAQFGPQILFAPASGALADRVDRRVQVAVGRGVIAVASGGLAAWLWSAPGGHATAAWPVIVSALVAGMGIVATIPAQHALVPSLVEARELAPAMELNAVPATIARALGPGAGALVAVALGAHTALAFAALANVAFAVIVLRLRTRELPAPPADVDRRIRAAFVYVRGDRSALALLVGVFAVGIGCDPVITLTPALSVLLTGDAALVGSLASAFGVGAAAAFLFISRLRHAIGVSTLATRGLVLLGVSTAVAGYSPKLWAAVASFVAAGVGMTLSLTGLSTQLQARVPEDLRGRVMALWSVAFLGSRPVASAVNGAVADTTDPRFAFLLVAAVISVIAWRGRAARTVASCPTTA